MLPSAIAAAMGRDPPACAPCGVVIAGAWQLLVVLLVQASSSQLVAVLVVLLAVLLAVLLVSRRLR